MKIQKLLSKSHLFLTLSSLPLLLNCSGGGGDTAGSTNSINGSFTPWTYQTGPASSKATGVTGLALGASDEIYSVGTTNGGFDGNTLTGTTDFFLAKHSSTGSKIWIRQLGATTSATSSFSVATHSNGYIYTTGVTDGNLGGATINGNHDAFIVAYDSNGTYISTNLLGVTGKYTAGRSIAVGSDNHLYLMGYTSGDLSGQSTPSPGGWFSTFLSKYQIGAHGGLIHVWTRLLGGSGNSTFGFATAVDSNLSQLICGTTFVALNGPLAGSQDLFIAQYDSNGNQSWIRQLGAIGTSSTCFALTLDSANNIYMTGETSANLDGNTKAGNKDLFIIKFDAKGNKLWTKLLGASGGATVGNSIALNSSLNEIRVAGETCANLGGQTLVGTCDGFYSRFDSNGNHIATTLVGSAGVKSQFLALKVDSIGSSILGGETYGSIGAQLTGLKDLLIKKIP